MNTRNKLGSSTLTVLAVLFVGGGLPVCAQTTVTESVAQTTKKHYWNAPTTNIVEEDLMSTRRSVPRVVEKRILIAPNNVGDMRARSNYAKRLSDMLEQITMGYNRGWLTKDQYDNLRDAQASAGMEETVLRIANGGKVALSDVQQLEKHLNSLAYTINQQIDAGSKVADRAPLP